MFRAGIFLCACALSLACTPAPKEPLPQPVQLGPWMVDVAPDQITVAWTTATPNVGRVEARAPDGSSRAAQDPAPTIDHRVLLTGLLPGTRYEFHVLGDLLARGSFTTAPSATNDPFEHPFTVLVYGDNRTNGGDHALVVNAAQAAGAQLALHTGDMVVDAKDQRSWERWFNVERDLLATTPIVPTVGNHEITDQGVTYSRHFKKPGMPTYRSLDYGNVHVQVLDSFEIQAGADPHAGAVSEAQKAWAEADARAVPADRHLWMLVHQGPHTHPREMRPGHGGLVGVQDLIAMVRKVHPVEAVFAGHEHFYERGEIDGLKYFVFGGGGAPLEDPDPQGQGVKVALKELSFATVEVCGCHVNGVTWDIEGKPLDRFELSSCERPCAVPSSLQSPSAANVAMPINSPAAPRAVSSNADAGQSP